MPDSRVVIPEKPKVQFRLQSAKIGNGHKETKPGFITMGIIIEDQSLSLLQSMYDKMKTGTPKYRGLSQDTKNSTKIDYFSSFMKDNGENPCSN